MVNFKLMKTTFGGMKISLNEDILFSFDKGPNIMDILYSYNLQDVTSLLKSSWNKLRDFALKHIDLNMEIKRLLDNCSFQNFDVYKPITIDPLIVYDEKKISALLPHDYTLYCVDKSLGFSNKYFREVGNNNLEKISVHISRKAFLGDYNPFEGGIAVCKPYFALLTLKNFILSKFSKVSLNREGVCVVPLGYTLYAKDRNMDSILKVGEDAKRSKYVFVNGANVDNYVIIQDEFYYSFLLIDEIQGIVEEEFYTKRNGLF